MIFARYGLFIAFLPIIYFINRFRIYVNNSNDKGMILMAIMYYVILGIFNPIIGNEMSGFIFLFAPLLATRIE